MTAELWKCSPVRAGRLRRRAPAGRLARAADRVGPGAQRPADTSGAMKTLADQPFGQVLLWLVAVGLAALALWQASAVIWGYRNLEGAERVRKQITSSAKAVVFAALGYSAGAAALGAGSSSSQSQQQATSGVLGWPGGRVIVIVADSSSSAWVWPRSSRVSRSRSLRRSTPRRCRRSCGPPQHGWVKWDTSPKVWPSAWSAACSAMRR